MIAAGIEIPDGRRSMQQHFPDVSSRFSRAPLRPDRAMPALIRKTEGALRAVPREELSPAGMWAEDHARLLMDEAEALIRTLGRGKRLPGAAGVPRLLTAARRVLAEGEGAVSAALILRGMRPEGDDPEWTEEELALLRPALLCALMERIREALEACCREVALYARAEQTARSFAGDENARLAGEEDLLAALIEALSRREAGDALRRAEDLLQRQGRNIGEIREAERERRALAGARMGAFIRSLRCLARLPFPRLAERLSPVAAVLRREDTYRRMDAESRALYRQAAARIAGSMRVRETSVARAACALAEGGEGAEGEAGYYLLERPDQIREYLLHRPLRLERFARRHRQGLFVTPLYLGAGAALALGAALGTPWYLWPLLPLGASEIVRTVYGAALRRFVPPRRLPRMRVNSLTPDTRVLVAVPALITSRRQALRLCRHLAVLRSAHPDPHLHFMLLADFADADAETCPGDDEILLAANLSVEALNRRYGGGFYYFHRARAWDPGQGQYTGRERKRGALEALNRLITEGRCRDSFLYSSCDPGSLKDRYAFVITLDADTVLPPGAVHQLVGALLHPLQKGRVVVIQPRMETAADTVCTRIQKLLGGRGGVDFYHLSAQDAYQDVFGRGSFVGKGIYEPRLWLERLAGRLPSGRLLSHDLIEGEIAVSALADNIVLFDGHPARLAGWQRRLHRWTRGDWQLLPFLRDSRLPLLSRHKIADGLRRSLVPAAQTALLIAGAGLRLPALFLLGAPWPLRGMGKRLMLLPGKAWTCLDAAARALYRLGISHRKLLSWVTAAQGDRDGWPPLACVLAQVFSGMAISALSLTPGLFLPGALLGAAWLASPLLIPWADGPAFRPRPLTPAMEENLRGLARDTWRFFARHVTADTLFLPPDNVQLDPARGPALRTSPTNIGLYLLSCCAARELGVITTAETARRVSDTVNTLEKLDTWKGHFYNWYDLTDGAPLPPRFVSTVDSGNLAGCLLACGQLLRERLGEMTEAERSLPARLDVLAGKMDFAALYDAGARLFYVGWDEQNRRPAAAHYDTLASEARLASYLAVMTGQVPRKHWTALGRAVVRAGGGKALLSWGGTMFEYFMPSLLLPLLPDTLLGEGCLCAARAQISHDPALPFGVSESGYYAFDAEMNYQYRAFGLPLLALSGETAGRVIAPYASMLLLPFFPRAAAENLARMQQLGWQGEMGLYEAADATPQRVDGTLRIVKSHMAHHQGMILCALCNALCDRKLVRAFMRQPAAGAQADLLWERPAAAARRRTPLLPPREDAGPEDFLCRPARDGLPLDAHALYGGGTVWVLTAHGQGYLAHRGMMITRFWPEAGEQTGPQFYFRDAASGAFVRPAAEGAPVFDGGCVRYETRWRGWEIRMRCAVDPLSGMAVTEMRARNTEKREREAEMVSFLEIAQGSQAADAAHPNYRDLSVQVLPWGGQGLISRRLPRDAADETPFIGHAAVGNTAALARQGDRTAFLGREGSYAAPAQLTDGEEPPDRLGGTLAPCLSLRGLVRAAPGEETALYFITCVGASEQELTALRLTPEGMETVFSLARTHARMTLRSLRMDGRTLFLYQRMLGALLFTGQPHQAALPTAPQSALWRWGVGGDRPLILADLSEGPDQALIRHVLTAHAWMRGQGIETEALFFCPEETGYARPCRDAAVRLIEASGARELLGVPGGLYLASGGEAEKKAAESLARLCLRSGQPLSAQLAALAIRTPAGNKGTPERPAPAEAPRLFQDNSFGGFTDEGGYWVRRLAPAPWHHLLCGPHFGTLVCEGGILHSYAGNSRLSRLTRLSPDVTRPRPSEEIYLLDEAGRPWPLARCAALYEPGVTQYSVRAGRVEARTAVFSHETRSFGVRAVTLRCQEEIQVRLAYTVRFALGERPEDTRCRAEGAFVFARSGGMEGVAWAALEGGGGQALSPAAVYGLTGAEAPWALTQPAHGGGTEGVMTVPVRISPRRPLRVTLALGWSRQEADAREDFAALLSQGAAEALRQVRAAWGRRLDGLTLFSGDPALDRMMNLWLPYQTRTSRLMARMGPYQQGGAIGFRDQLQDLLALLAVEPEAARAHLLLCAAHQYPEGDVQHWWHPPRLGVRTRISDDALFLPYMTALYVQVTGDQTVLDAPAPYLLSAPLGEAESERYEEPEESAWTESLRSHCIRAVDHVRLGAHGLPLMGGGDWNDGMNRVGGKTGESVWLGFFLAVVLREFAPLCPPEVRERFGEMRRQILFHAESAWTGRWYLRAWRDGGEPLGGPDTQPPRIDLITQCFAVLAGAPREKARTALGCAVEKLYLPGEGLVKLLDPPFAPEENAGYIGAYLPGVRENGGQYTHGAAWLILALCRLGEYDRAWEIARTLMPCAHGDTREKILRYRAEPYVLAADVYAGESLGRAGWTWYTGSAAWLYHAVLTALLGFEKRGDKVRLSPCPRRNAEEFTVTYRFGTARYLLTAAPDALFPTLDGVKLDDGWASLAADGRTHEARFPLRQS